VKEDDIKLGGSGYLDSWEKSDFKGNYIVRGTTKCKREFCSFQVTFL